MKHLAILTVAGLPLLMPIRARSEEGSESAHLMPPPAKLALDLNRGISIDRQFRSIPPEAIMRITREDIQLIKRMGFEFVKLIVNPEPLMSGNRLNRSNQWYLKKIVDLVVNEGLPVVVCIHPEWEFKKALLSDLEHHRTHLPDKGIPPAGPAGAGRGATPVSSLGRERSLGPPG